MASRVCYLYDTLMNLFRPMPFRDARHLSTLCWMVCGLLGSGWIALDEWVPFMAGRAVYAQSTVRRFRRWLSNPRVDALRLYAGLVRGALAGQSDKRLYVALDTTVLWNQFCVVQASLVWRGRSVPLAWKTLEHASASVAFKDYRGVLGFTARLLEGREVVLLADRGFAHTELLRWARKAGWHFRIRCKRDVGLFWRDGRRLALRLSAGELRFYAGVFLGNARVPMEIAVGWEKGAKEPWVVMTDEAAEPDTLHDCGLRFAVEEGFLDCKSGGFQWESSRLRDADTLQRLGLVMATATLALACQGAAIVEEGRRREVDPHWTRGLSYVRIGWNGVRRALACGWGLVATLNLPTALDPEPVRPSRRQPDRSRWADDLPSRYFFFFALPSTG